MRAVFFASLSLLAFALAADDSNIDSGLLIEIFGGMGGEGSDW